MTFAAHSFNNAHHNDWVEVLSSTLIESIIDILVQTTGLPYRPYYRPQSQGESEVITYVIRKRTHTEELAGAAGQATLWLELTSWSYSYSTAISNAESIRAVLDDLVGIFGGYKVEALVYESDRHLTDHDGADMPWLYSVVSTYRIVYVEPLPSELED